MSFLSRIFFTLNYGLDWVVGTYHLAVDLVHGSCDFFQLLGVAQGDESEAFALPGSIFYDPDTGD